MDCNQLGRKRKESRTRHAVFHRTPFNYSNLTRACQVWDVSRNESRLSFSCCVANKFNEILVFVQCSSWTGNLTSPCSRTSTRYTIFQEMKETNNKTDYLKYFAFSLAISLINCLFAFHYVLLPVT